MAFSARLVSVAKKNGVAACLIEFTMDADVWTEQLGIHAAGLGADWLAQQIALRKAQVEGIYAFADTLAVGPIAPLVVDPPTKEDIDKAAYFALLRKQQNVKMAIDANALDPQLPEVTELEDDVKAKGKVEYFG